MTNTNKKYFGSNDIEKLKEKFINQLKARYINQDYLSGIIKINISDYPEHAFSIKYDNKSIAIETISEQNPDAQISIPLNVIYQISEKGEYFNWDLLHNSKNNNFFGNTSHLEFFRNLCLRPHKKTLARYHRAERLHARRNYSDLKKIRYFHNPTQLQILETIKIGNPVIVTGHEKEIARKKWSLKRINKKFGHIVVNPPKLEDKQALSVFLDTTKSSKTVDNVSLPYEMWADLGAILFDLDEFIKPVLFVGFAPQNTQCSELSRMPLAVFYIQLMGTKRIEIYSADQNKLLYPNQFYSEQQKCWFEPKHPNYKKYPKAKNVQSISTTIKKGEVLVLPAGWFSRADDLTSPNMMVGYCWRYM